MNGFRSALFRRFVPRVRAPLANLLAAYSFLFIALPALLQAQDWKRLHIDGMEAYTQGRYIEAEQLLTKALGFAQAAKTRDAGLLEIWADLGTTKQSLGRDAEAESIDRRVLALREQAFGKNDSRVAVALNNVAAVLLVAGRPRDAEAPAQRALQIWKTLGIQDGVDFGRAVGNLGAIYRATGRNAQAEKHLLAQMFMPDSAALCH